MNQELTAEPESPPRMLTDQRLQATQRLVWWLRIIGTVDLLAFAALVQPAACLQQAHHGLGMGTFPDAIVAVYLVRTASMLYGLCGLLLLFLSSDVRRYLPVIQFIAICGMAAGVVLVAIGFSAGLPTWWILLEGPGCSLIWACTWHFARSVSREAPSITTTTASSSRPW